jgi:hypothetical protein
LLRLLHRLSFFSGKYLSAEFLAIETGLSLESRREGEESRGVRNSALTQLSGRTGGPQNISFSLSVYFYIGGFPDVLT